MKERFDWVRGQTKTRKKYANERYEDMMRINAITIAEYERGKIEAYDCVLAMIDEAEAMCEKDYCEWERDWALPPFKYRIDTKCGYTFYDADHTVPFKFCPHCGNPIKILEVE